jgi:hypothetical protein
VSELDREKEKEIERERESTTFLWLFNLVEINILEQWIKLF